MNQLPILPKPSASLPTPPILILLLPEHCPNPLSAAPSKTEQPIVRSRLTAFSATFEFVFTPNHQHDGINE